MIRAQVSLAGFVCPETGKGESTYKKEQYAAIETNFLETMR
jgi:hypothetical protein